MSRQRQKKPRFSIPVFPILLILAVVWVAVNVYRGEYGQSDKGVLHAQAQTNLAKDISLRCDVVKSTFGRIPARGADSLIAELAGGEELDFTTLGGFATFQEGKEYSFFIQNGKVVAAGPGHLCPDSARR